MSQTILIDDLKAKKTTFPRVKCEMYRERLNSCTIANGSSEVKKKNIQKMFSTNW